MCSVWVLCVDYLCVWFIFGVCMVYMCVCGLSVVNVGDLCIVYVIFVFNVC